MGMSDAAMKEGPEPHVTSITKTTAVAAASQQQT